MIISEQKYSVDKNVSRITWEDSQHREINGLLPVKEGFIALNEDQITGGSFLLDFSEMNVSAGKSEEKESKLVEYLKSKDFFDAKNHPEGKFTITDVYEINENLKTLEATENEGLVENPTHRLSGNLTLKGQTHQVHFPARVNHRGNALSTEAKFTIDKNRWNVANMIESPVVSKENGNFEKSLITISFHIEAGETVHK